jgi:phosphoenolpyruvate-protein kinase (PTS system EI component)
MINRINSDILPGQTYKPGSSQPSSMNGSDNPQPAKGDTVVLGETTDITGITYQKPAAKPDLQEVDKLWEQAQKASESLRNLVEKLISRQGQTLNSILSGNEVLIIDAEARAEANQAISEEGELGVTAVSDQIVAFARAISGNDPERIAELKAAIDKGFSEAARILGGELPEICQKTYQAVMDKMDQWSNEG